MSELAASPDVDRGESYQHLRDRIFPRTQRRLTGALRIFVTATSAGLTLLTVYMAFFVTLGPIVTRALHLLVAIPLTLLLYPALARSRDRGPRLLDYLLAAAAAASFGWAVASAERFEMRFAYVEPVAPLDLLFGVLALATIFEATRRTIGLSIVVLNLIFIAYAVSGAYWPGLLQHKGTSFPYLIEHLYMLSDGIFNFIMGIMATFLFTFLAFGAFLQVSGGDRVFTDLALSVAGHRRGGPAKVAVISSALMGMLSGSTVSNVATTGALTIPMMIRTGFRRFEAAAIESAASVGGALTPPIMGAGVFIMAAFTGVPLATILGYSVAPALLYFASVYFYVHIKARKGDLPPLAAGALPRTREVIRYHGHVFLPVLILIYLLLADYTPYFASSASIVAIVVASYLRRATRLTPRKLLVALEASTRIALTVSSLSASAAIIYGVITATGLLVKASSVILSLAGGSLLAAILLIAAMAYALGMGLPVTASYVLVAALGAPALNELGLPVLAAHLIIFWFSQYATVTPPICMTAFVAARIADAPPMRTGWESVRVAKALYVIPFLFAYGNLLSESVAEILFDSWALFGAFALLPMILEGYFITRLDVRERVLLGAAMAGLVFSVSGALIEGWIWAMGASVLAASTLVRSKKKISLAST